MPEGPLSPRDWRRVSELLDELLDLPADEQEVRLAALAGQEPAVGRELRELLASDRESAGLLDAQPAEAFETLIREVTLESDSAPEQVGPYRVVEELGRGGMGVVYLAERSDGEYEQRVALKLVKRGLDTDAILDRFRRERQILARLQHPAIARLLDGGAASDGRPYFAMELVEGEPLTEACDRRELDIEARLRLFRRACEAVQYAHGQLVVHRDLKPSNILLEEAGGLKLLDFGIARLLDEEPDATRMTEPGSRPLTPAYAAPEQLRGEPATVSTDVYALGLILRELLCGVRPASHEASSSTGLTPSALAASDKADGPTAAARSRARRTDPATLARRLAGDLDAIVGKALHIEPERRYASAEALSRDIDRHLTGQPVEAAPDSTLYRLRKFVSRHRVGVASTTALLLALLGGMAGTVWQARQKALEARKAEEVKEFALGLFAAVDPALAQGDEVTALELVAQGAERVETELVGQPEIQAEMELLLGNVYWNLGRSESGLELIDRALTRSPASTSPVRRGSALRSKGGILVDLGRAEEARPLLLEALALHREALGPAHTEVAEDLDRLVMLSQAVGEVDAARSYAERSLAARLESLGDEHVDTADSYNNLGVLYRQAGDYERAEKSYERALTIRRDQLGERHPETLDSLGNYATLLYFQGRYEESRLRFSRLVELHDAVYGTEHPSTVRARNNLAAQLTQLGRFDQAEELYTTVLAFWAETTGLDHPNALGTRSNLAVIERMRGRLDGAERADREVLEAATGILGETHPLTARFGSRLASTLREAGKLEEAERLASEALETHEKAFGSEAPQVANDLHLVGLVARDRRDLDAARDHLERALAIRTSNHGLESVFTAESQTALGDVLRRAGDTGRALELLRMGLATYEAELPPGHPAIAWSNWLLGLGLHATGDGAQAGLALGEAHRLSADAFGSDSWRTAAVSVDLGACLYDLGRQEEGRTTAEAGLATLEAELGRSHPLHRSAAARVAALSGEA